MKYSALSLTLRPRGGIQEKHIDILMSYVKKKTKYHYVITEKNDEARHIHAALFMMDEVTTSSFGQTMKRMFDSLFQETNSVWKYACTTKPMFNDDFVTTYMEKGDDTVEVSKTLPDEEERCTYYKDVPSKAKRDTYGDPYYMRLMRLYDQWEDKTGRPDLYEIERFLMISMVKNYTINAIPDDRKFRRTCKMLYMYLRKSESYLFETGDVAAASNIQPYQM